MHDVPDTELFSAYLDGELTADEQVRVEQILAASPEARRLVEELRAMSGALQDLPQEKLDEDLSGRVLEIAERRMLLPEQSSKDTASNKPSAGRAAESLGSAEKESVGWLGIAWRDISWRGMLSRRALLWSSVIIITAFVIHFTSPPPPQKPNREVARTEEKVRHDAAPAAPAEKRRGSSETNAKWETMPDQPGKPRGDELLAKTDKIAERQVAADSERRDTVERRKQSEELAARGTPTAKLRESEKSVAGEKEEEFVRARRLSDRAAPAEIAASRDEKKDEGGAKHAEMAKKPAESVAAAGPPPATVPAPEPAKPAAPAADISDVAKDLPTGGNGQGAGLALAGKPADAKEPASGLANQPLPKAEQAKIAESGFAQKKSMPRGESVAGVNPASSPAPAEPLQPATAAAPAGQRNRKAGSDSRLAFEPASPGVPAGKALLAPKSGAVPPAKGKHGWHDDSVDSDGSVGGQLARAAQGQQFKEGGSETARRGSSANVVQVRVDASVSAVRNKVFEGLLSQQGLTGGSEAKAAQKNKSQQALEFAQESQSQDAPAMPSGPLVYQFDASPKQLTALLNQLRQRTDIFSSVKIDAASSAVASSLENAYGSRGNKEDDADAKAALGDSKRQQSLAKADRSAAHLDRQEAKPQDAAASVGGKAVPATPPLVAPVRQHVVFVLNVVDRPVAAERAPAAEPPAAAKPASK